MRTAIIILMSIYITVMTINYNNKRFVPSVTIDRWIPKNIERPNFEVQGKLTKADAG